eukprot:UN06362
MWFKLQNNVYVFQREVRLCLGKSCFYHFSYTWMILKPIVFGENFNQF